MASNKEDGQQPLYTSTPVRSVSLQGRGLDWRQGRNDPKRKYISSPELLSSNCARCDNELSEDKIDCRSCKLIFCLRCSGLTSAALNFIKNGGLDDYRFLCRSCKQTQPTLENIDDKLTRISSVQEQRLRTLEEKFSNIEATNKRTIQAEMESASKIMTKTLEDKIAKAVEDKTKEYEDRRRRELNIVIFNLPESNHRIGRQNKEEDEQKVRDIAEALGLDNLDIETSYRLGKKDQSKTRVLKVILKDRKQRKFLLVNSKNINQTELDDNMKKVVIFRDLTDEQRKERKQKRRSAENKQIEFTVPPSHHHHSNQNSNQNPQVANRDEHSNQLNLSQEIEDPFGTQTVIDATHTNTLLRDQNDPQSTVIGGILAGERPEVGNSTELRISPHCDQSQF